MNVGALLPGFVLKLGWELLFSQESAKDLEPALEHRAQNRNLVVDIVVNHGSGLVGVRSGETPYELFQARRISHWERQKESRQGWAIPAFTEKTGRRDQDSDSTLFELREYLLSRLLTDPSVDDRCPDFLLEHLMQEITLLLTVTENKNKMTFLDTLDNILGYSMIACRISTDNAEELLDGFITGVLKIGLVTSQAR